ncbi:MAG: OmpH family outer membrane protein [Sediminibacterium sp.]|nr:OmpH family outer membrane protein [Sediminibacterium sp.]
MRFCLIMLTMAFIGLGWLFYKSSNIPSIAYVKSSDLVYSYLGMKDAQKKQAAEESKLKASLDSMRLNMESEINQYNASFAALSKTEQSRQKEILAAKENAYRNFGQSVQERLKNSDESLTTGVLNQINSFIEEYGQKKGYDIILGTTTSGNILYGQKYMDITKDVLKELNASYKSGSH